MMKKIRKISDILKKKNSAQVPVTTDAVPAKADYRLQFILPAAERNSSSRKSIYIKEAYADIISKLAAAGPNDNLTIGGYINAVLEHHFEVYRKEIQDYYDAGRDKPLGL